MSPQDQTPRADNTDTETAQNFSVLEAIEGTATAETVPAVTLHHLPGDSSMSLVQRLRADIANPLYRNAYALMLSTVLTSLLGLVYWIVAAHTATDAEVGRAAAAIATVQLVSSLTQLNFMQALIRFLPRAGRQSTHLILWTYAIAAALAALVTIPLLVIANRLTASSSALHTTLAFGALFTLTSCTWSVFSLQDSVLTGLRRTVWVPIENGTFGVVKIALVLALAPAFASTGIFASWTIPILLSLIPVNWAIFRHFVPRHEREVNKSHQPITPRIVGRFIAGDYTGNVFSQMSTTLLPVIVLAQLGKEHTAHFSMAQIIGTGLDLVAFNLGSSLTVEAANDEKRSRELAKAALRRMGLIIVPSAVVLMAAAPLLLQQAFGTSYRHDATLLLQLLAFASVPRCINVMYSSVARIQHRTHLIAASQAAQSIITVGLGLALLKPLGIKGVGVAALVSQITVALVVGPGLLRFLWAKP